MKNIINSKVLYQSLGVCFCLAISALFAYSQIASGGTYIIEKSVVAGGGATSSSGNYKIEGTIGQNASGTQQQNSPFKVQSGFWTAEPFAPTAAEVTVSGSILTADGRGIRNVLVTMVKSSGESRTVISSALGYFRFGNVAAGETYIFSVSAKRYAFSQPTIVRSIVRDADDIVFTANNGIQIPAIRINDSPQP